MSPAVVEPPAGGMLAFVLGCLSWASVADGGEQHSRQERLARYPAPVLQDDPVHVVDDEGGGKDDSIEDKGSQLSLSLYHWEIMRFAYTLVSL